MGGFRKLGVPFWDPHNKGYHILGSILRFPILGHCSVSPTLQFRILTATQNYRMEEHGISTGHCWGW